MKNTNKREKDKHFLRDDDVGQKKLREKKYPTLRGDFTVM